MTLDPNIEVFSFTNSNTIAYDRFEMPMFFILGTSDDKYQSDLVGQDIQNLVRHKTIDPIPNGIYGVYASRALLPTSGYARTFPIESFLNETWPILSNINSTKISDIQPTNIEMTWIIRAFRRANDNQMANAIKYNMLKRLYPEKISNDDVPTTLNVNSLSVLYTKLSDVQRNYPIYTVINDLPFALNKTLGDVLSQISITGCTSADLKALKISLDLLSLT